MATMTLPGLGTGIDTASLVKQLVTAESSRMKLMQQRKQTWQTRSGAYEKLETRLETLHDAADSLRDASNLRSYDISTSDETVVTASASSRASAGSHELVVNRLATAERSVHAGLAATDTLVGTGTFAYTYNGTTRLVHTDDTTTLEGLRDLINDDAGNPGVNASILEYDAGDGLAHHLVLSGNDSGSDYAIEIAAATTLDGTDGTMDLTAASFTEAQTAQDSQIRIDGYPSGDWIERSGNTIEDVLAGVTLQLQSTGTSQVSLSRDTEGLKEKIQDLVESYNGVVELIQEQTAYDQDSDEAGPLIGDHALRQIRHQLRVMFAEAVPGFQDGADALSLAGQIGLSIDAQGMLELDAETMDDAIAEGYLDVLRLLGADHSGASNSDYLSFYDATDDTQAGIYEVEADFDGAGTLTAARIRRSGETTWRDAAIDGGRIYGQSGNPEAYLEITAAWDGVSTTQTAEVRVQQGFAGRMYDEIEHILDSETGVLGLASARCTSSINRLDDNIEQQMDRLARMEERLTLKFARMEQSLMLLERQRVALGMASSGS